MYICICMYIWRERENTCIYKYITFVSASAFRAAASSASLDRFAAAATNNNISSNNTKMDCHQMVESMWHIYATKFPIISVTFASASTFWAAASSASLDRLRPPQYAHVPHIYAYIYAYVYTYIYTYICMYIWRERIHAYTYISPVSLPPLFWLQPPPRPSTVLRPPPRIIILVVITLKWIAIDGGK